MSSGFSIAIPENYSSSIFQNSVVVVIEMKISSIQLRMGLKYRQVNISPLRGSPPGRIF